MLSSVRRREIAAFLKVRRARLQPEQLGLPRGARRRTPGLRREEVAELAGISTEWYAWLEQTRDVRPSQETLQRIGVALRLDPAEQQHLLTLAGYGGESRGQEAAREAVVSSPLQSLMDQLGSCPAWVIGARSDILGWNRAATVIHGNLGALSGLERNGIYQLFLGPRMRVMLKDWEAHARDCVAKLRLVHANYIDDPWFNELVDLLCEDSAEFAAWWSEHDVLLPLDGVKVYDHPAMGRLAFDYAILRVLGGNGVPLQLITYMPRSGTDTREKMESLIHHPVDVLFPQ
ncbi:helix-turn-helix transcriptional regulator [Billgrantia saliphila]|uniref:helix-turn-helix transcriptional regulator n=1 Tax=Billgrantia saliphila TaxID=1848458 RepID=UPI0018CC4C16|nr:helix-turn-helix transcriptional regulator [Halomonas saliphila]